jgi:hypothetical protein
MLFVPRWHLTSIAEAEGIATVPELRYSISYRDAVLTVSMRTLSGDGGDVMPPSPEVQEAALHPRVHHEDGNHSLRIPPAGHFPLKVKRRCRLD